MVEWFKNLSENWQIALFTSVVAAIGGLFAFFLKWFFGKNNGTALSGVVIPPPIDPNNVLDNYTITLKQLGHSEEKNKHQQEIIRKLEDKLAQSQVQANTSEQYIPPPTQEAKDLAAQIEDDAGPYALALKAIAEGDNEKADGLLDQTQQVLDTVQQTKDKAQAKIYMARMNNASYAGKHQEALEYCDKLQPLAGDDPAILNDMAVTYLENARYKKAEPLMRQALKIAETSFGPEHPIVATRLNNLSQLLKTTNHLEEAESLMRRALEINETSLGHEHPKVAEDLSNLAQLLLATSRLGEAEPLIRRALKIFEATFGHEHPRVAGELNNLGGLLLFANRFDEAEPLIRRALKIDEESLGLEHPDVGRDLNNLGGIMKNTNRLNEAEPLMRRALKITETSFGPMHPKVAIALNNLAQLLRATNRLDEVEPLIRRALKIAETSFGSVHSDIAGYLNNLALLLQTMNRLNEAEPLMKRTLVIFLQFSRQTGYPHPHLEAAINNYSDLLIQMGHSHNEIVDRLKSMDPEVFKSLNKKDE